MGSQTGQKVLPADGRYWALTFMEAWSFHVTVSTTALYTMSVSLFMDAW